MIWVAYNHAGDLIGSADSEEELYSQINANYTAADIAFIGAVTA